MIPTNDKKRIGIFTHYHNSLNYGGNLQAYALCRVLSDLRYDAQQVAYDRRHDPSFWKNSSHSIVYRLAKFVYRAFISRPLNAYRNRSVLISLKARRNAFLTFNHDAIPHSDTVYSHKTLSECIGLYDVFITGSDQVWHPSAVCEAYLLDFVDGKKTPKLSYAASMAVDSLSATQLSRYQQSLSDYQAISVREANAVSILQPAVSVCVEQVLDPTLLLTDEQWDAFVPKRSIEAPYLFCFFLGDTPKHRSLAEEYAKKHGLQIVTLPHLSGSFRKCDKDFGDIKLYDVSPPDFISLIKYSACVFTDSFHTSVFSIIYHKEFFIFDRSSSQSMGSRIVSLLDLFGFQERYCNVPSKMTPQYIGSLQALDYTVPFPKFDTMKNCSLAFLQRNLDIATGRMTSHEN